MSVVYCYKDCVHKSKRKANKYTNKKGDPIYRCTLGIIIIQECIPGDGIDYTVTKQCECPNFSKRSENDCQE